MSAAAAESAAVGLLQNKIQSGSFVGATESATVGLLLNKIIQSGGGDGDGGDGGGSGGEGGKSDEGVQAKSQIHDVLGAM